MDGGKVNMDGGTARGTANAGKKLHAAIAQELGAVLGQQLSHLQQEISIHFENVRDMAVHSLERSLASHIPVDGELQKPSQADPQRQISSDSDLHGSNLPGEPLPLDPETVPQPAAEELKILDVGDAWKRNKATPLSIIPSVDVQATSPLETSVYSTAKPLSTQAQEKTSSIIQATLASLAKEKAPVSERSSLADSQETSLGERISKACNVWKYADKFNTTEKLRQSVAEPPPDLFETVKAAVFADPAGMKEKMRKELLHHSHTVVKYKETGLAQVIAKSPKFEIMTTFVIVFNVFWMAVDVDMNHAKTLLDAHALFIVVDVFFCTYFLVELLIRFCAYDRKKDCLSDGWFCFDAGLVILMVTETGIMTFVIWLLNVDSDKMFGNYQNASILRVFRFARLTKISRIAKLYHLFPELVTMVRGFKFAARTVFLCFILVIGVIYVWALMFREFTNDLEVGRKYFNTVPDSMATLLFQGTMPDVEPFIQDVAKGRIIAGVFLVIFMFLTTFTLMNMLVGVIVGVVSEIADAERERRTIGYVKKQLSKVFACREIDEDFDGTISEAEFETFLTHPVSIQALTSVGVDVVGLVDISEFIFQMDSDRVLSFPDLLELVLNLRGANGATVKDVVDLRMFLTQQILKMETRITKQLQRTTHLLKEKLMVADGPTLVKHTAPAPVRPAQNNAWSGKNRPTIC